MCRVPIGVPLGFKWDERTQKRNREQMKDKYDCSNDDARSMKVCYAPAGTEIRVYDHPDFGGDDPNNVKDDWAAIWVDRSMGDKCEWVPTFQPTNGPWGNGITRYSDSDGKSSASGHMVVFPFIRNKKNPSKNELDGKVSSFTITSSKL